MKLDNSFRIRVSERLKEYRIDDRKDRGSRADSERERGDRRDGESGTAQEHSERVLHVLHLR
jgi:hypothetical protein